MSPVLDRVPTRKVIWQQPGQNLRIGLQTLCGYRKASAGGALGRLPRRGGILESAHRAYAGFPNLVKCKLLVHDIGVNKTNPLVALDPILKCDHQAWSNAEVGISSIS